MEKAVKQLTRTHELVAVCPSGRPGKRVLPAAEVVRWFEDRGVAFLYTGIRGVKIRYKANFPGGSGTAVVDIPGMF